MQMIKSKAKMNYAIGTLNFNGMLNLQMISRTHFLPKAIQFQAAMK